MFGRRAIGWSPLFGLSDGRGNLEKGSEKNVETSEKIWGYVAGEGEFENRVFEPLGPLKRAPKNFEIFVCGQLRVNMGFGLRLKKE